jgi:hypothetical protein
MPKTLLVTLLSLLPALAQAGSYSAAECGNAQHNRWINDSCQHAGGGGHCAASFDGETLTVSLAGQTFSGTVSEPYEMQFGQGAFARRDVNFGGLDRGMMQENRAHNPTMVEIYVNHDSSGSTYTKYTCHL